MASKKIWDQNIWGEKDFSEELTEMIDGEEMTGKGIDSEELTRGEIVSFFYGWFFTAGYFRGWLFWYNRFCLFVVLRL